MLRPRIAASPRQISLRLTPRRQTRRRLLIKLRPLISRPLLIRPRIRHRPRQTPRQPILVHPSRPHRRLHRISRRQLIKHHLIVHLRRTQDLPQTPRLAQRRQRIRPARHLISYPRMPRRQTLRLLCQINRPSSLLLTQASRPQMPDRPLTFLLISHRTSLRFHRMTASRFRLQISHRLNPRQQGTAPTLDLRPTQRRPQQTQVLRPLISHLLQSSRQRSPYLRPQT